MQTPTKLAAMSLIALTALTGCSSLDQTLNDVTNQIPTATSSTTAADDTPTYIPSVNPADYVPIHWPAQEATPQEISAARELAATLHIAHQDSSDYQRTAQFGEAWLDVDGNGCDTRNDILTRDLTKPTIDNRCRVTAGTLNDPYTGTTIEFTRGTDTSSEVQIEHIVALNDAWGSGAREWTQEQRIAFANDPANLMAVDGSQNQAKGAKDAAQWAVPENPAYTCTYLTRQAILKSHYQLSVDKAEYAALNDGLATC